MCRIPPYISRSALKTSSLTISQKQQTCCGNFPRCYATQSLGSPSGECSLGCLRVPSLIGPVWLPERLSNLFGQLWRGAILNHDLGLQHEQWFPARFNFFVWCYPLVAASLYAAAKTSNQWSRAARTTTATNRRQSGLKTTGIFDQSIQ